METDKFAGQETGVAAILAVFSAVAGLIILFAGKPGLGLLFEISAAVLGIIGVFMAVSPRANREIMSIIAIAIAVSGLAYRSWVLSAAQSFESANRKEML